MASSWVAYHVEDPSQPKPRGAVRIMCMSDSHSLHSTIPPPVIFPADIAFHAGDFTNVGKPEDVHSFCKWFGDLPAKYRVAVAGNHELSFDPEQRRKLSWRFIQLGYTTEPSECKPIMKEYPNVIYAEDEVLELEGLKIFCSPRSPGIPGWAFHSRPENKGKEWNLITPEIDIVVTHSPPAGILDWGLDKVAYGDPYLAQKIQQCHTPCHIFGHVHECHSQYRSGKTLYVNCSIIDARYKYWVPPTYIDMVHQVDPFEPEVDPLDFTSLCKMSNGSF